MSFELEIMHAESVERWQTKRAHRRGSIGGHMHRVAIYAYQIAKLLEWPGSYTALLLHCLFHDMPEVVTGDIPGPVKRAAMDCDALDEYEYNQMADRFTGREWRMNHLPISEQSPIIAIRKLADALDEIFWLGHENRMGNRTLEPMYGQIAGRVWSRVEYLCKMLDSPQHLRSNLTREISAAVERHYKEDVVFARD